jgi:hypothetical protein
MDPSQVLLQAEVNSIDEEEEQKDDDRSPDYSKNNQDYHRNQDPSAPLIDKLYPTAPPADDSSDANSTASVHSTSV